MAVHFVTGKLGGGKSLVSVGRIKDYLQAGKKVATNLDINLEYLLPAGFDQKCEVFRIPDKPIIDDLREIGYGTRSKKDEDFGLLVLDELGTWLNARNYQKDKGRQDVIDWFLHARKYGWDVILIVQDPELLDKQVRIALGEHVCICRRTDRIPIHFISFFLKTITGWQPRLPRIHVGSVFYGSGAGAIKVDTWVFRGNSLFKCYDTSQIFCDGEDRVSQYLPPKYLKPLNTATKNFNFIMRLTKIYFKKYKTPFVFLCGLSLNILVLSAFAIYSNATTESPLQDKVEQVKETEKEPTESATPTELIPLSFIVSTDAKGRTKTTMFYENKMFTSQNSPYPLEWINGTPSAVMEIKEEITAKITI